MNATQHEDTMNTGQVKAPSLVARFEVAEVRLSTADYAVVRLEPLVPEGAGDWTDEQFAAWSEENEQFSPKGDGIVLTIDDDEIRPGQIVRLTLEIE